MSSPTSDATNPRQQRIREVVAEFLRDAESNTSSSEQAWITQYPELMPELGEQLHAARLIQAAREPDDSLATVVAL